MYYVEKIYSSSIILQVAGYSCPEEEFGFLGGDLVDVFFILRFLFLEGAIFHFLISNILWPTLLMIFWISVWMWLNCPCISSSSLRWYVVYALIFFFQFWKTSNLFLGRHLWSCNLARVRHDVWADHRLSVLELPQGWAFVLGEKLWRRSRKIPGRCLRLFLFVLYFFCFISGRDSLLYFPGSVSHFITGKIPTFTFSKIFHSKHLHVPPFIPWKQRTHYA